MKDKELIKIIKKRLSYNPETGKCFWISTNKFATSFLNKEAGSLKKYNGISRIRIMIDNVEYYRYRVAYILMTGAEPDIIDHINGVTTDDRWENLRNVTHIENCRNRSIKDTRGVCSYGVRKTKTGYTARICVNKKQIHIGVFKTEKEAHEAYIKAKIKHHGPIFRGYKNEN